jgi:hypothetical protein
MLLKKEHINSAMSLDAAGVSFALRNNDYPDDKVKTATFGGMTEMGSFVYHCTYADSDTCKDEDCIVYVRYNKLCKLVAEY